MMNPNYWLRQTDKPLYPELEWSRPENRLQAGKLLIVGGSGYEFQAPANAYGDVLDAGIGTAKVLLPDSIQKTVRDIFPEAEFAPSTPSGSFSTAALAQCLDLAAWADGVLLPGNIGRNSETSVLLEMFLEKYNGQVTITKDTADFFCDNPLNVLHRPETVLVLAMGQLRRLGSAAKFPRAFTTEMDMVRLVEALQEFTKRFSLHIVTRHQQQLVVAANGQITTTKLADTMPIWRLRMAAAGSVWWLQNPAKPLAALSTAAYQLTR